MQQQQNPVVNPTSNEEQKAAAPAVTISLKPLETAQITQTTAQKPSTYEYNYVYKDLKKTLFFAALSVIFEFALSRLV